MLNSQEQTRRNFLKGASAFSVGVLLSPLPGQLLAQEQTEAITDLDPSPQNPRNSEGAFVTLRSGRILFAYTRFYGGSNDGSPAQIVSVFSDDQGKTWNSKHKVEVENHAAENVMSVSLLRLHSGAIAMFYLVKNSLLDCRPVMRVSRDEAESWSEPHVLTHAPGYFVLNNDRVIQLKSGRLVVPLALHRARGNDPKGKGVWDRRAITLWLLSDDQGNTWRESEDWWGVPERSRSGLQEPGVVETAPNELLSWMRTDRGVQYGSWSKDGGSTWSPVEKTGMVSPESPASVKQIPGSTDLLGVYNDHSGRFPFSANKRTPLVSAISKDAGRTWTPGRLLESDPAGWFCYTAIHFVEDKVLLAYCAGDKKTGGLNRLRVRRVDLEGLRRGL